MMVQLCTMATAHVDNAVWVPMPIIHPKNWLLVVENSQLFTQHTHGTRCAPLVCSSLGISLLVNSKWPASWLTSHSR